MRKYVTMKTFIRSKISFVPLQNTKNYEQI